MKIRSLLLLSAAVMVSLTTIPFGTRFFIQEEQALPSLRSQNSSLRNKTKTAASRWRKPIKKWIRRIN